MDEWLLIYDGPLPRVSFDSVHPRARMAFTWRCLNAFGWVTRPETRKAHVYITRVLGPRQRLWDDDIFHLRLIGLVNALKQGRFIKDDSPYWIRTEYIQDSGRRDKGPRIEVVITYQEDCP